CLCSRRRGWRSSSWVRARGSVISPVSLRTSLLSSSSARIRATMATFGNLSARLTDTFKNLRTKGKLSASDVDSTVREIRRALLEADVALDVVKNVTASVRERALGDEVNQALNPAQQVVQIVNEELVGILGGEQRRLTFAKNPPTVIMLAGLQGAGKTTLAGKLRSEERRVGKETTTRGPATRS